MMLPVLMAVLGIETTLGFLLISKIPPLEKLACMLIDLTQSPKGSAVSRTLVGTLLIFMASSASTYVNTQRQVSRVQASPEGHGHVNASDIFILRTAELESAMTVFIFLLTVFINRTHYYLRGKRGLTMQLEVLKKQSKGAENEYMRLKSESNVGQTAGQTDTETDDTSPKDLIAELRKKVEVLQNDVQTKDKDLKAAESSGQALRKQSEGMALEYERSLEECDNLRTQISSFDRQNSRSSGKKDT